MEKNFYTHRIAVNAYLIEKDKFLLLKRNKAPFIWSPPGGRLLKDEDPVKGLQREVKEETNLEIEVIAPVNTWFGNWEGWPLLSIDYLAKVTSGELQLSSEHSEAIWVTIDDLNHGSPAQLDPNIGFKIEDFMKAQNLSRLFL
jgi:8-oxo-dGTP diphosphatase